MSELLELIVTTEFLTSDYLPECCVFTGRPGPLRKYPVRVIYKGYIQGDWWKPKEKVGPWHAIIQMPSEWRVKGSEYLWQFLIGFCGLLGGMLGFALVAMIATLFAPGSPIAGLKTWAVMVGIWSIIVAFWYLGRYQIHRRTRFEAQPNEGEIKIIFPKQCRAIFDEYSAGWNSYVLAGRPKAAKRDKDEGWEDRAAVGWDEGQR